MEKTALCIGINDYPGTGTDLAGCVNDANDWADALRRRGFAVRKLLDERATGAAIRDGIVDLLDEARPGDRVVIQFSGHGSFVPDEDNDERDGTDECLCPYDVAKKGPITDDDLFALQSARARGVRVLMISDSCHSGTVERFAKISTPPTMLGPVAPQRKVRFLPPASYLSPRRLRRLRGSHQGISGGAPGRKAALLMSACGEAELSFDAWFEGRPNGAFTYVALRTLEELPARATYRRWLSKIRAALPSQQYPQTPELHGASRAKAWRVLE